MNNTKSLTDLVESDFLPFVRRPGRYIGGEINQVKKDLSKCRLKVALCFPDVYEVAMSNSGLAILYDILNRIDGVAAERAFAVWLDAEKILREKKIPLFSLESRLPLRNFDVVGFGLSSELCYSNVLNMLELGGINIRSSSRSEDEPFVIAGGAMANCCEPIADFIDLFVLGEAEQAVVELAELFLAGRAKGLSKHEILLNAARRFEWAYVPQFYRFEYDGSRIKNFEPAVSGLPTRLKNAIVEDFENSPVPLRPIVPFAEAVHERVSIEVMRGCPGRCRFCQASFCRRPVRYRSVDKIIDTAKAVWRASGFDTIGLLSLSTADYPALEQLTAGLTEYFQPKHVGLSLPSLRVDQQLKLIPQLAVSTRKGGLTIAVEAAGENVRRIINKPLKDEDLFAAVQASWQAGWRLLKLYFMVGLPGETEQDIRRIVGLSFELAQLRKKVGGRAGQINVAVSWFVPKPHTPFGWLSQESADYFARAKQLILGEKKRLAAGCLQFKFHHIDRSILESALARGDRRLTAVIESAWRAGARFDLWDECFNYELWQDCFAKAGLSIAALAGRRFEPDEILPWQHLGGPEKDYLLGHLDEALALITD